MLNDVMGLYASGDAFQTWLDALKQGKTAALYDLCEGQRAFLACTLAQETGAPVLLIAQNDAAALRITDDCQTLSRGRAAYFPPETVTFMRGAASRETQDRRLETLIRGKKGELSVLVSTIEALQTRLPSPALFDRMTIRLLTGSVYPPQKLISDLVSAGYERQDMVEGKGQCALRGAIVDVFPPDHDHALRIEFFDDEVDSIRTFDLLSQRSVDKLSKAVIIPAQAFLYGEDQKKQAAETLRTLVRNQMTLRPKESLHNMDDPMLHASGISRMLDDADKLEEGALPNAHLFAGLLSDNTGTILDWLGKSYVLVDAPDTVCTRAQDRRAGFEEDLKLALSREEALPQQEKLVLTWEEVLAQLSLFPLTTMQDFLRGMSGIHPDVTISMPGTSAAHYPGRFLELSKDVQAFARDNYLVVLLSGGKARGERLQAALENQGMKLPYAEDDAEMHRGKPSILPATLSRGFILKAEKIAVISDSDIFGAGYKKARKTRTAGEKIEAFTDLHEGDYVVHEQHGVGIFKGTVRLQTEGTYRDYLLIQYRGSDKLYVPTDQFDRVQKYIGGQDNLPELSSLGTNEWDKKKKKVQAGLKKLAFDLVKLYADRKAIPGHAFAPDTPWQRQFEDHFPYELTPDQQRAVRDITQDMEAPTNMDRLLCGDVGYGKTEVAMRAAFKAIMDGKQVALLAPTTILAQQHYLTAVKRFQDFPVTIDVLSRFRSPKEQKETLQRLKEGKVDLLVGTHRLLGKDVQFKDLGLLIVDEEQRFGVQHKETIKHMKTSVDVLTLSATPIPRTLHMSMVGVRDMSLLETPPEERLPVQTYVIDYQDAIIRDAIRRELARHGQVYFLYNRVASIDQFASRLKTLLPEARIGVAHGQMKETQLEDIMLDFYEGRYDVLLSTTIIENGLDVPSANTLIVYDADRFGLSQLYQLRGRVGRSNRMAYAYFTVRPDKMITEDAQKRLNAIREFTAFGSGFRIAMRDLEIRGAGNIFGPEQSGNVSTVGYDLYVKMIEEAVRQAQGGATQGVHQADTRIDLKVDAFLPGEYVRGEAQRMEIYKRISLIRTREDREDVIEELIDRFGDPPGCVMRLIDIAHLRALVSRIGVARVTYLGGVLQMRFDPTLLPPLDKLVGALERTDKRLLLSAAREPAILLRDSHLDVQGALTVAIPMMEKVLRILYPD